MRETVVPESVAVKVGIIGLPDASLCRRLAYRHGAASLTEPLGLLRQHLREHPNPYLSRQVYLQPYLDDL
jgi:hypothetical protein